MRVLHLNSIGRFSTGNIACSILNQFDGEKMFLYAHDTCDYDFSIKIYDKFTKYSNAVLRRILGKRELYSYINTKKFLKKIEEFNPDIIHIHNLHGAYINYRMLFKFIKKNKYKVVWTLHDCWSFTGFCPYYDFIGCDKWKSLCYDCPVIKNGAFTLFDTSKREYLSKKKIFLGVANMHIVCPSVWLKSQVKQSFLKDYPISVIYNGINLDNFVRQDNHTFDNVIDRNKKIVLAVASSWGVRKGYNDLFKVKEKLGDEYQLVVVGVTESQKNELEKSGIIAILRTKNQKELAELYSIAEVFINPTYEEVFGLVNIEAIACGCPIITYNTGGAVEMVNENNGLIVAKGNVNAMVEAISKVATMSFDYDINRQFIVDNFVANKMNEDYCRLYKGI